MNEHPTNNQELLDKVEAAHSEWQQLLSEVGAGRMGEPGVTGEWSVKDIIAHIAAWEGRVLDRMESEATGAPLEMAGWDMDKMNEAFYEHSRERSLEAVLQDAHAAHAHLMDRVQSLSEEALFEGGHFQWTNGDPLCYWIAGNTYEHYDEHAAPIREWLARTADDGR